MINYSISVFASRMKAIKLFWYLRSRLTPGEVLPDHPSTLFGKKYDKPLKVYSRTTGQNHS